MTTTLPEATDRFVSVNGVRLHLAEAGTHGPRVLLLHGYPQHGYAWRQVMADLSEDRRVYALDLRGAGQSDAPRLGYDTATLTADVLAVMNTLAPPVTLAGHEWGGWLGFHVALATPERLKAFVALNSLHPWVPQSKLLPHMWRFWYTALLEYPVLGAWVIRTRPQVLRWLLRRGRPSLSDAEVDLFADVAREPARARAGQQLHWQAVRRGIPHKLLGRYRHQHLSVPTLLLAGRHDFAISPRCLNDAGPHADQMALRIVENAGHYLPEEQSILVAAAVRQMANGISPDQITLS